MLSFIVLFLSKDVRSTGQFSDSYIVAVLVSLISGIVYAGGLILSRTGERPLLKLAGIVLLFQGLILLFCVVWALNSTTFMLGGTLTKVERWASLLTIPAHVLFALNFAHEKTTAKDPDKAGGESLATAMRVFTFAAVCFGLFFGLRLVTESIVIANGTKQNDNNLKEPDQPFEAHIFSNSRGEKLPYRLLKPLDYDSTQKYPLVVCLHGSSGCGNDNSKQVGSSLTAQLLSEHDNRVNYPAFVFVPQCPTEKSWGGVPNFPAVDALVFEAIDDLERKLSIDKDRRYVTGNSLGGYGVWHFITTRPDMFAAATPISGAGSPTLAKNSIHVPVWAFHGAKDRNVPVKGSRLMIEAMKSAGGTPLYTEYQDAAHDIGEKVKNTPSLLDWLFDQRAIN
ncbi:alpha/beta hydrolase-fold protein [Ravibacter arvi]